MSLFFLWYESSVFEKRHLSEEELKGLIKRKRDKKLLEKLIFIRSFYDIEVVEKAVKKLGRCKTTKDL